MASEDGMAYEDAPPRVVHRASLRMERLAGHLSGRDPHRDLSFSLTSGNDSSELPFSKSYNST